MRLEILVVVILVVILVVIICRSGSKCDVRQQVGQGVGHEDHEKSETIPVFMRNDGRMIVSSPKVSESKNLPSSFDARSAWPGMITPVMDQGACGSCWAFASSSIFSDRLKISSNGTKLASNDYISPYCLAACMKCPNTLNAICKNVCSGNYIDDVLRHLAVNGSYSMGTINANNGNGTEYICFRPSRGIDRVSPFRANSEYRVNPFTPMELNSSSNLLTNERTIMDEIVTYGPVTATIRVFNPMSSNHRSKNFYLYEHGVYGTNWSADPKESDGYHAITIIGFGEEVVGGISTKFWLIRNSWGKSWGSGGYGKVLRGRNRAIVESDIWALHC